MDDTKYTEDDIKWAINELKKKHPERATREQAIKFLDTFGKLGKNIVNLIKEDTKSGKLKSKPKN